MSCATWLGRVVTRIFVAGLHNSLGEQIFASEIARGHRHLSSSSSSSETSTNNNNEEQLGELMKKATEKEVARISLASQMCRALHSTWHDFHLGAGFVSVVSGLPKDFASSHFRRGQFGDDAWFIARNTSADVIGVADGVGGWRNHGVDPGEFSFSLMRACEKLVENDLFSPTKPERLLANGFSRIREANRVTGSSTACVLVLSRSDAMLYSANLGDSGFVVVRDGIVVHRSKEQTHCFNTPFQLSCLPPGQQGLSDSPESADISQIPVKDGDVILLATDGVFDNLPDYLIVSELSKIQGQKDPLQLQSAANAIALMARTLAFDSKYMSPFARNARLYGYHTVGGKPDDITVLLATVSIER
ncbi:Protein phosphatase PTC7 [Orchesella cincta]|uniref:Protein phosphatase n=1 Tax=Orchesella cincta TaxID=48709 RepID=A0A1D2NKP3_ORCCI|nr:Protein phosphatase PTC7 [Orchesella cincta]